MALSLCTFTPHLTVTCEHELTYLHNNIQTNPAMQTRTLHESTASQNILIVRDVTKKWQSYCDVSKLAYILFVLLEIATVATIAQKFSSIKLVLVILHRKWDNRPIKIMSLCLQLVNKVKSK